MRGAGSRRAGACGSATVIGLGAYDLPTYLRPGLYGGLLVPAGGGWDIGMYLGAHYMLADSLAVREAVTVRAPLTPHLWLRTDFALMENEVGPGTDAMLGLGGEL